MIGQRGVPATFGGVEHHVEELGARLVARGHDVTVFSRPNYISGRSKTYRGMRVRVVPTLGTKHLDAFVHSAIASAVVLRGGWDIVHYHALGPGLFAPLPRFLSRARVVQTIHGLDDERDKWSRAARVVLGAARWLSARVPDATVVVSRHVEAAYADARSAIAVIPNGVAAPAPHPPMRAPLGLDGCRFVLFVGRLVPEKAPDALLRAWARVDTDARLVVAGGSSYTDAFVTSLKALASTDPRVVLAGYVYGDDLAWLYRNAAAFVLPSRVEGLPLTLLEAASYGVPLVLSDIPPHREVVGEPGPGRRLFAVGDEGALAAMLHDVLGAPDIERAGAAAFRGHVLARYSWDTVTDATEQLYRQVVAGRRPPHGRVHA